MPHEHEKLSQVESLVIDGATATPLPMVKSLLGRYMVFLSSTVNGYEGTECSLLLKLVRRLAYGANFWQDSSVNQRYAAARSSNISAILFAADPCIRL
ncbi:hypothetical protein KIW84_054808 [Lathyrus oleraceus]|uniref:TcmA/NAT10 helicase domain-containing protein n=1 Tax=Pisum sativum TaxID=3888 RepID=A0A9D4WZ05_PEA|nr:hypothetical protein KIW84_054808 [Pisum sativum]